MTNFEKIKQMSVEDMAEMLLDASEKHFTYCNHCSYQTTSFIFLSASTRTRCVPMTILRWVICNGSERD